MDLVVVDSEREVVDAAVVDLEREVEDLEVIVAVAAVHSVAVVVVDLEREAADSAVAVVVVSAVVDTASKGDGLNTTTNDSRTCDTGTVFTKRNL